MICEKDRRAVSFRPRDFTSRVFIFEGSSSVGTRRHSLLFPPISRGPPTSCPVDKLSRCQTVTSYGGVTVYWVQTRREVTSSIFGSEVTSCREFQNKTVTWQFVVTTRCRVESSRSPNALAYLSWNVTECKCWQFNRPKMGFSRTGSNLYLTNRSSFILKTVNYRSHHF